MNEQLTMQLIDIAQSQVGVRETGGENQGEDILKYMRATWMPEESNQLGYAWCAAFICWCMTQTVQKLNLNIEDYVYFGADAFGWEKFAEKKGWVLFDENELALPGDLVTFDFSHIGIVTEDHKNWIATIEGNTNPDGAREGDGVYVKEREPRSLVRKFIRVG